MSNRNYNDYNNFRDFQAERSSSLINIDPELHSPRSGNLFKQLTRRFKLNKIDLTFLSLLGLASIYLIFTQPVMVCVLLSSSLFFYCLSLIVKSIPMLNRMIGIRIRFWHIASVIMALVCVLSLFNQPAQAIFMSGLESYLRGIVQTSNTNGGTTNSIDPASIGLIFNAIRGVFLLLVGVAALFAYNQAQQGNDWRPIATQIGLALGIILTVDVITFLFVGNTTGQSNAILPILRSFGIA